MWLLVFHGGGSLSSFQNLLHHLFFTKASTHVIPYNTTINMVPSLSLPLFKQPWPFNALHRHPTQAFLCSPQALPSRRRVVAQANPEEEHAGTARGVGARERRLHKLNHERRQRERERGNKPPEWATILENACKDDAELREILGDSIGDPEEMERRIMERVRRKGRDILQPKTGSSVPMPATFRDFDPTDSYIWLELYSAPADKDVEIIGSVIRSWYLLGRLGGFNTLNLQLSKIPLNKSMSYNPNHEEEPLPACFHNIGNLEFQDNWGRFWVDLGTSDPLALDILINSLSAVSSDHVGIKELTFGGNHLGDWEEGMTSEEDGYKKYKI